MVKSKLFPRSGYVVGTIKLLFLNNGNNHYSITPAAPINEFLKTHDACFSYTVDLYQRVKSILLHLSQAVNFSQCMLCWYVCMLICKKSDTVKIENCFLSKMNMFNDV